MPFNAMDIKCLQISPQNKETHPSYYIPTKMGGHLTIFISNNGSYKCSDTFIFQYYYL